ncbi:MAG: glycosyltransferase family 2 protein [Chlorobiales bacterium]|nr:glycosyltransferase family 2 protein [Chlorobiales bacterium]
MPKNPKRYVVVIPVFNQFYYTSKCVESLLKQNVTLKEILIIDNASSDETPLWLAKHPELKYRRNNVNLGCGCAWVQGVVLCPDAEWVVLLNNDVLAGPDAIGALLDAAEREKLSVVSPALLEGPNDYGFEKFAVGFKQKMSGMIRRGRFHGVCFAVHRSVFEKVGFPDSDRRLGGYEDAEFLFRCRRANIPVGIVGDSVFHHFGSITQKAVAEKTKQKSLGDRKYFRIRVGSKWWARKMEKFLFWFEFRKWREEELGKSGFTLHMVSKSGTWEMH